MKTYLVGGAVRDKLMHQEPKDQDWVIVGATPDDVARLLAEGYSQVGADFPVFLHPKTGDEYALARIERKTGSGYHGFVVEADASVTIEDDLARRDLTINSMAIDEDGKIIDPYGGRKDLRNQVLRHTTAAFAEDPLRVMRLARFSARYKHFVVAPETIELCKGLCAAGELNHLSIERVWTEMVKGFGECSPRNFLTVLESTGALTSCAVLQDYFGPSITEHQYAIADSLSASSENRAVLAIALLAREESKLEGATSRVRDLHANLRVLWHSSKTSADLMLLLKKAKALSEGDAFGDLALAVLALEHGGFHPPFKYKQLVTGRKIMRGVRAADFPGLQGKELGQAIDGKRVDEMQHAMSIPKGESAQQMG